MLSFEPPAKIPLVRGIRYEIENGTPYFVPCPGDFFLDPVFPGDPWIYMPSQPLPSDDLHKRLHEVVMPRGRGAQIVSTFSLKGEPPAPLYDNLWFRADKLPTLQNKEFSLRFDHEGYLLCSPHGMHADELVATFQQVVKGKNLQWEFEWPHRDKRLQKRRYGFPPCVLD